jgi:phage/plasmid-associated DNA primase
VRYLYVSEPDDGKDSRFNVDFIKSTTGGDPITTRALYGKNVTFIPQFSVQVQCNNKPKLGKIDKGIVRRIKIIPYLLNFVDNPKLPTDRKRDYNLVDEINKEEFRNEFILMLIDKAVEYFDKDYSKDIKIPLRVSNETNEYFDDNNPIKEWIDANIEITNNENNKIKTTDIHKLYNDDDVDTHLNSKDMITYMKFNGFETKKSNGTNWYIKCKLKPRPAKNEFED